MRRVELDHGERRPTAVLILHSSSPPPRQIRARRRPFPPSQSRRAQYSCRTAPDKNGVARRKCERIVRKFRQCPGQPRELVEESREETDETDPKSTESAGGFEFFDRSSSTEFFEKTWEGASGGFPGGVFPGSAFPFPFGSLLGALFGEEPPGGSSAGGGRGAGPGDAFRGLFREMTREMERMEGRDRVREDDAPAGAPAATDDWSRGSKRV